MHCTRDCFQIFRSRALANSCSRVHIPPQNEKRKRQRLAELREGISRQYLTLQFQRRALFRTASRSFQNLPNCALLCLPVRHLTQCKIGRTRAPKVRVENSCDKTHRIIEKEPFRNASGNVLNHLEYRSRKRQTSMKQRVVRERRRRERKSSRQHVWLQQMPFRTASGSFLKLFKNLL